MQIKENFNLSFKKLVLIVVCAALVGGGVFFAVSKSVAWGVEKYQQWGKVRPQNFLATVEEFFKKQQPQSVQPLRIVDEQSQVIEVVKKASPAVVSIVASAQVPTYETYSDLPAGIPEQFRQFFSVPQQRQNGTQERKIGAGTGFLVSADGYIITNKHVVSEQNADYTVYLNNEKNLGEKIKAKVIARDPQNDLAVLKIDKENLPFLTFADSGKLQVGQTVITIGYALGEFNNTVSKGVISGLARSITAGGGFAQTEKLKNLIQSDAAINPGNSGGPMLDLEGNVIGINVAMASAENIGFALLGNEAKDVFEQVKSTGNIAEKAVAFLGARYLQITPEFQKANNLPYGYGALIVRGQQQTDLAIAPGSPADKAGLVENDIILEVNGQKLTEENPLADLIAKHNPGDEVTLKIAHKGQESEVKIVLGKK